MFTRFIEDINWLPIFSLIIASALLSVLGDSVGSKWGKKRVSIFRLRPKYTSRLITALTGALIAVGILSVMAVLSQDVRTALFGMKILKQQLYDLQFQLTQNERTTDQMRASLAEASASLDLTGFELDTMRNDRLILEQEKRELEAALRIMREESSQLRHELKLLRSEAIALSANVLLGQTAFEAGSSREEIIEGLNDLKQQVRLNVLTRISDQSFTRLIDIPVEFESEDEEALIDELLSADMRHYVRALSGENYTVGENMRVMIRLETGKSILTYRDGSPVYRKFFRNDKAENNPTPEEILHIFLRELRNKAVNDGILPEPLTNNVGTLDGETFFSAVDLLGRITEPVIISAVASGDIYTEGPVVISIVFEE
ncbi:MAG: DUF3084 domain-containing protein [Synergistaceae bacterium]|nr:DUF3084 domain-containing protein [Synergistaceae bacterium]